MMSLSWVSHASYDVGIIITMPMIPSVLKRGHESGEDCLIFLVTYRVLGVGNRRGRGTINRRNGDLFRRTG
jgi:hypothetical protein